MRFSTPPPGPQEHGQLYWYLDYVFTCAINASRLLHAAKPSADAFAAAAAAAAGGLGLGGLRLAGGKKGGKAGGKAAQAAHAAALAQYAAEHAATSSNHLLMDCHRLLCQVRAQAARGAAHADVVWGSLCMLATRNAHGLPAAAVPGARAGGEGRRFR